jgi:hypothetical protein
MEPSGVHFSTRTSFDPPSRRRALGATALLCVLALAACQPTASTPPASSGAGPSGAASGAPSASPAPTISGVFRVVGDSPVIARTAFTDRGAVLPGAVISDGETYHAWVIAFASAPGTQEVHHMTSTDSLSWTEEADASLAGLSEGLGNPGAMPTSVLQVDEQWVMYFVGTLASEQAGWDIWRATAPSLDGPWTRSEEPVLTRGAAGSFDAGGLDFPTVMATEEGFAMFYSGITDSTSTDGSIGMATSTDGIAWTKADAAVAEPGLCGGFDDRALHQPRVVQGEAGLLMAYVGYAGAADSPGTVGFADSLDAGATWSCEWPGPALNTTGLPEGDVHTIAAFDKAGRLALLVEWLSDGGTDIWQAHFGLGD